MIITSAPEAPPAPSTAGGEQAREERQQCDRQVLGNECPQFHPRGMPPVPQGKAESGEAAEVVVHN